MNIDKEKILKDAVDNFGVISQIDMAIEECAELIQALNKIKRTFHPDDLVAFLKGDVKFNNVKQSLVYCNCCSEIADVTIMMKQLRRIFSPEHIDISEDRKLIRLQERIIKHKH